MTDIVERRLRETLGSVVCPEVFHGDNLAIVFCTAFDDGSEHENDNGWSDAATTGADAAMDAIHAHYADTITALRADLAEAQARAESAEAALRSQRAGVLPRIVGLLKRWQMDGCPDCHGDCASANPPIPCCIIQETRDVLALIDATKEQQP